MDETTVGSVSPEPTPPSGGWRRDVACILLLLALAGGMRALVIQKTSVAARDSIGFIRYAWRLEHDPLDQVLRESLHPPLYPLTILATSVPLRKVMPADSPDCLAMQASAQIAAAIAGVLLVIPMYFMGRGLFDRSVGFFAALLFQCMPVASRALSDGLTEGIYLLLTASFIVVGAWSLRSRSMLGFAVCGLLSGLAYLTRPEGAMLALVLGAVLLGMQVAPRLRWPRLRLAGCLFALPLTALALAGPYMATIKGFSNKNSAHWLIKSEPDGKPRADATRGDFPARSGLLLADLGPLLAEWERGWKAGSRHDCSFQWAVTTLLREMGKGFHYLVCIPVALGLLWFPGRIRTNPICWIGTALCVLYAIILLRLAMVAGYLSERHSLLFVLCAAPWAIAGMREIPAKLSTLGRMLRLPNVVTEWGGYRKLAGGVFVVVLCLYGLPNSLRTLHPTRVGFREAGLWIADHARPTDEVLDPFCWARFYSGRELVRPTPPAADAGRLTYIVLDNIYSFDHHSHLPALQIAEQEAKGFAPVYHWPANVEVSKALVLVYAVPWKPLALPTQ